MLGFIILFAQNFPNRRPDWMSEWRAVWSHWASDPLQPGTHLALAVVGGWFFLLGFLLLLLVGTGYRVGSRYFMVTMLGIPVRWVRLDNIRHVSTERVSWAERWHNQIFVKPQTVLVIRKRRGLFRHLVVTPKHRHALMAEINRARDVLVASEGIMPDFGPARR